MTGNIFQVTGPLWRPLAPHCSSPKVLELPLYATKAEQKGDRPCTMLQWWCCFSNMLPL